MKSPDLSICLSGGYPAGSVALSFSDNSLTLPRDMFWLRRVVVSTNGDCVPSEAYMLWLWQLQKHPETFATIA
jgi:hypothetical protein